MTAFTIETRSTSHAKLAIQETAHWRTQLEKTGAIAPIYLHRLWALRLLSSRQHDFFAAAC